MENRTGRLLVESRKFLSNFLEARVEKKVGINPSYMIIGSISVASVAFVDTYKTYCMIF